MKVFPTVGHSASCRCSRASHVSRFETLGVIRKRQCSRNWKFSLSSDAMDLFGGVPRTSMTLPVHVLKWAEILDGTCPEFQNICNNPHRPLVGYLTDAEGNLKEIFSLVEVCCLLRLRIRVLTAQCR